MGTIGAHEEVDLPAKSEADQQYFALSGAVIGNAIITDLFGVAPPRGDAAPNPAELVRDADTPRGFDGVLRHLRIRGSLYTVTSNADKGVTAAHEAPAETVIF